MLRARGRRLAMLLAGEPTASGIEPSLCRLATLKAWVCERDSPARELLPLLLLLPSPFATALSSNLTPGFAAPLLAELDFGAGWLLLFLAASGEYSRRGSPVGLADVEAPQPIGTGSCWPQLNFA